MLHYIRLVSGIWLCCLLSMSIHAQEATECKPTQGPRIAAQGEVFLNYGSAVGAVSKESFPTRSDYSIGQPLVGAAFGANRGEFGFFSRLLLPPQAPLVEATQGDLVDRVQLSWELDPLSPVATEGYIITRDGNFLTRIDAGLNNFIDFNVQAGEFYEYGVQGVNAFGDGFLGTSVGFINPNGVVTGQVRTFSGNPVQDAVVTLTPTIGRSLQFSGQGGIRMCIPQRGLTHGYVHGFGLGKNR